jgi:Ca2+-dependent lipid-binding protein
MMGFGTASSSDPLVRIDVDKDRKQTKHIPKNLNPKWNEELIFEVEDSSAAIKVTVEDYGIPKNTFMGRCTFQLSDYDDKKAKTTWFKLSSKNLEADSISRGEIELRIQWKFSVEVRARILAKQKKEENSFLGKMKKQVSTIGRAVGVVEKEDEIADEEVGIY